MRLLAFLLLAALAVGGTLSAQATANPGQQIRIGDNDAGATAGTAKPQPLVSTWDFVRMVLILAAVVGAIYFFFYLLRRGTAPARPQSEMIRVIAERSLSGSRSLYLIEVGTSVFLVGGSESQVSLVAQISDRESLDAVRVAAAQSPERPPARHGFAEALGAMFSPASRSLTARDSLSFLKKQKDRLKRM